MIDSGGSKKDNWCLQSFHSHRYYDVVLGANLLIETYFFPYCWNGVGHKLNNIICVIFLTSCYCWNMNLYEIYVYLYLGSNYVHSTYT